MKKTFKCMIKIESPIHIGCDEVYDPVSFVMDEKNNFLVPFEPSEFITSLDDQARDKLSSICCQGNLSSLLKLYKFFRGRKTDGRRVSVTPEFVSHYQETLKISEREIKQKLNKFIVERSAFRPWDNRPYLPGSSIKGSLRTGYLNHLCKGQKLNTRQAKALEQRLMDYRSIDDDPFARVKVSDFQPAGNVKTKIVYAVNKKKKLSDKEAGGPYQILEVIEPGAIFIGDISVEDVHPKSSIKKPVNLETLLIGANNFFINEHSRENRQLSAVNIHAQEIQQHGGEKMLFRLGRHSGAESVTISGNRDIKIMLGRGNRPKFLDHATTFWLASPGKTAKLSSGLLPFGWSCIEAISPSHEKKLNSLEKEYQQSLVIAAQNMAKAAALQLQKEEELQKKIAEEQKKLEQKKIQEAQRQAQLDAMTPEDRELATIFDSGSILENEVVELFNRLDKMEKNFRQKSAEKIKAFYIQEGKWKVNKKKKKQFAKVSKLKIIIGEINGKHDVSNI